MKFRNFRIFLSLLLCFWVLGPQSARGLETATEEPSRYLALESLYLEEVLPLAEAGDFDQVRNLLEIHAKNAVDPAEKSVAKILLAALITTEGLFQSSAPSPNGDLPVYPVFDIQPGQTLVKTWKINSTYTNADMGFAKLGETIRLDGDSVVVDVSLGQRRGWYDSDIVKISLQEVGEKIFNGEWVLWQAEGRQKPVPLKGQKILREEANRIIREVLNSEIDRYRNAPNGDLHYALAQYQLHLLERLNLEKKALARGKKKNDFGKKLEEIIPRHEEAIAVIDTILTNLETGRPPSDGLGNPETLKKLDITIWEFLVRWETPDPSFFESQETHVDICHQLLEEDDVDSALARYSMGIQELLSVRTQLESNDVHRAFKKGLGGLLRAPQPSLEEIPLGGQSILENPDGQPSVTANLNQAIALGLIDYDPFVLSSQDLLALWGQESYYLRLHKYNDRAQKTHEGLSNRALPLITREDVLREAFRALAIELKQTELQHVRESWQEIHGSLMLALTWKRVTEFGRALGAVVWDTATDPLTWLGIGAAYAGGKIAASFLFRMATFMARRQALKVGIEVVTRTMVEQQLKRIPLRMIGMAISATLFWGIRNAGAAILFDEDPDWSVGSLTRTFLAFVYLRGASSLITRNAGRHVSACFFRPTPVRATFNSAKRILEGGGTRLSRSWIRAWAQDKRRTALRIMQNTLKATPHRTLENAAMGGAYATFDLATLFYDEWQAGMPLTTEGIWENREYYLERAFQMALQYQFLHIGHSRGASARLAGMSP